MFRRAETIGPGPIPMAPGFDATFEWVASRKRKRSAKSDTLLQLSNLGIGPDSITITRQGNTLTKMATIAPGLGWAQLSSTLGSR